MSFIEINNKVLSSVKKDNYAGYDPFDLLNSKLIKYLRLNQFEYIRLILLQIGKRSPVNFRRLIGVPKLRNPKGVALFILGMIEDFKRTSNKSYLHEANSLAEWLLSQRSDQTLWKYSCWGYHFDWQARAFFVPKGKPNIITTCYVARALYELGGVLNKDEYIEVAMDSASFIYNTLLVKLDEKIFIAYIPGELTFVHNASLWGAAWLAEAGRYLDNEEYKSTSLKVARQSARCQNPDGSWPYGELHHHKFIDGFHTGYNLEALDSIRRSLNTDEFDMSIAKGMSYYKNIFFLNDGSAKYYNDNLYPLDMHSFSQAIVTLLKVDTCKENLLLAEKVAHSAIDTMYSSQDNRFIYQKYKWYTNKINYIRWTQAWSYYGLSYFNNYISQYENKED